MGRQKFRKRVPDDERQREREPDEGTKSSDVQGCDHPRLAFFHGGRTGTQIGLGQGEAVHEQPGTDSGEHEKRKPDQPGVGKIDLPNRHTGNDNERHNNLDHSDTKVPASGVQPERHPLVALRVEERDVGHGRGEVATTKPSQRGTDQQDGELRGVALPPQPVGRHKKSEQTGRQKQHGGRDDCPLTTTKPRHGEGVRNPKRSTNKIGERNRPERLRNGHGQASGIKVEHDNRPQNPNSEPKMLSKDRAHKVPTSDTTPGGAPEPLVLGPPVVDRLTHQLSTGGTAGQSRRGSYHTRWWHGSWRQARRHCEPPSRQAS